MFLERLEKLAEKISLVGAYVAAFLLVYMVCHILIEIFFRTVLDSSTYSLDEFVGYAVGAMTFLSLGHSLLCLLIQYHSGETPTAKLLV